MDADPVSGTLVLSSGGATVVAEAGDVRDVRVRAGRARGGGNGSGGNGSGEAADPGTGDGAEPDGDPFALPATRRRPDRDLKH